MVSFEYELDGRLKKIWRVEEGQGAGVVATTDFTYDGMGRLQTLSHRGPQSNPIEAVSYAYDKASRLTQVASSRVQHGLEIVLALEGVNEMSEDALIPLLEEIVCKYHPDWLPAVKAFTFSGLSNEQRSSLRNSCGEELCATGLDADYEPNERGKMLERLIDLIGLED